jgi:hypothetical protein
MCRGRFVGETTARDNWYTAPTPTHPGPFETNSAPFKTLVFCKAFKIQEIKADGRIEGSFGSFGTLWRSPWP